MNTISLIDKIQGTLRQLQDDLEQLRDALLGEDPPEFDKNKMGVKKLLEDIFESSKKSGTNG